MMKRFCVEQRVDVGYLSLVVSLALGLFEYGCYELVSVEGASCDAVHPCPNELYCVDGICRSFFNEETDECDGGTDCDELSTDSTTNTDSSSGAECEYDTECSLGDCLESFGICTAGQCAEMWMMTCPAGWFCFFADGSCASDDGREMGDCVERPALCNNVEEPVCGCDGRTYRNACQLFLASVSWAYDGACQAK